MDLHELRLNFVTWSPLWVIPTAFIYWPTGVALLVLQLGVMFWDLKVN